MTKCNEVLTGTSWAVYLSVLVVSMTKHINCISVWSSPLSPGNGSPVCVNLM